MDKQEWREQLGGLVRDLFRSTEMEQFYSTKVTVDRARLYVLQLGLYARDRRNHWPQVASNCPELDVKQKIYGHEHEELVEDEHSAVGHLDLVIRQGRELGLTQDEVLGAEPLPSTKAAFYAWAWLARTRTWQEGLAASTTAEWTNDDRLIGDLGGGNCSRLARNWARDLGFRPEQMPNFTVHSQADVKHSDMFLEIFEKHVPPGGEQGILNTVKESMDFHRVYFGGMAAAMARLS